MSTNDRRGARYQNCNGPAIKALRQRRGWTQAEFAKVAGYSARLVQKAEAGGAVAAETLNVLAQTLSADEAPITVEDIAATPQALAREFVDVINTHLGETGPAARHLVVDDVVIWCAGDPAVMPFAGEWVGYDAFCEFFRIFFTMLTPEDDGFFQNVQFLANANEVVVWCEAHARVAGMDSTPMVWVWHRNVIQDGKIARYENHFDTQAGSEHLAEANARGLLTGGEIAVE